VSHQLKFILNLSKMIKCILFNKMMRHCPKFISLLSPFFEFIGIVQHSRIFLYRLRSINHHGEFSLSYFDEFIWWNNNKVQRWDFVIESNQPPTYLWCSWSSILFLYISIHSCNIYDESRPDGATERPGDTCYPLGPSDTSGKDMSQKKWGFFRFL